MMRRRLLRLAVWMSVMGMLTMAPDAGFAQTTKTHRDLTTGFMQCNFCHSIHGSPGGKLNVADGFDNTCLTCHGSAGTFPNAPRVMNFHSNVVSEVDPGAECDDGSRPSCNERPFFLGCSTCHDNHGTFQINRLYNQGLNHNTDVTYAHDNTNDDPALCSSVGGPVRCDGFNQKLVGKNLDGTKIAKIATPVTVGGGSWAGGVATLNILINNAPDPPAHTFMAGDRITVRDVWSTNNPVGNFDLGFNGSFIIETVANPFTLTPTITYKLATDPGTYMQNTYSADDPDSGMVQSTGWHNAARVKGNGGVATWASGTATLRVLDEHSIEVGDSIAVTQVISVNNPTGAFNAGFNGIFPVSAVAGQEISYALATDPGVATYNTGRVEYAGSFKAIQTATHDGNAETLTLRIYNTHAIQPGSILTVFKDAPAASFNALHSVKRLLVTGITAVPPDHSDIELSCLPNSPNYDECDLRDPPDPPIVDFTGGIIQSTGSMRPVVFESRGTDFGEDYTHSFADVDEDNDNVMDGPCELCHTRVGINHPNYDLSDSHNRGRGCALSCHIHARPSGGFFRR